MCDKKMNDVLNEIVSGKWLYILILVVCIFLIIFVYRSSRKRKLQQRIEQGQIKVNEIGSHSFTVEIAQTEALARINKSLKDTTAQAKKDYDNIQLAVKDIVSQLQDANELVTVGSYKKAEAKLDECQKLIDEADQLSKKLQGVLKSVLNQSVLQRKRINELKDEFHQIKETVNASAANYTFCWEALDKQSQKISHKFSNFETIMDAGKYEEAATLSNEIADDLDSLNMRIQKLPDLINLAKNELPAVVDKIYNAYKALAEQGAYLDHLNVEGNIEQINQILANNLYRLKQCDITNVSESLIDCETRINQLSADLEVEKNAYRDLLNVQKQTQDYLNNTKLYLDRINNYDVDGFVRYGLKDLNKTYNDYQDRYYKNLDGYNSLMEVCNSHTTPASTMIVTFKQLNEDVVDGYNRFKSISNLLSGNKTSEARVKDLISRFVVVLNEAKASIKLSKLPSISSQYEEDITTAEGMVATISADLLNETVDVERMNKNVDEAQRLIVSLYHNVNNLTDTANDVENFIILCNKYRPYYPDIDSALYSAELAYRNGEYTKACKIVSNALEDVDPDLAEILMKKVNAKIKLQKEGA